VLRKTAVREGWGKMSKKGKRGRRGGSSDNESEEKVIGMETGLNSDSEENERRKGKEPAKREYHK